MNSPIDVTITGVDDAVDILDLVALSREFPFVEWAVLFSSKRQGTKRYPSNEWLCRFNEQASFSRLHTAAHLCGQAARDTLTGDDTWLTHFAAFHDRIQVNGYTPPAADILRGFAAEYGISFVLQCRDDTLIEAACDDAKKIGFGASVLYDLSQGGGIRPAKWPPSPPTCRLGFAGGITPANVLRVLEEIGPRTSFWIDMETGVRTDDEFDLSRARAVLEQVASLTKRQEDVTP